MPRAALPFLFEVLLGNEITFVRMWLLLEIRLLLNCGLIFTLISEIIQFHIVSEVEDVGSHEILLKSLSRKNKAVPRCNS